MAHTLLPTTLVGSYPQPDWLIDRKRLAARFPPRTRARDCSVLGMLPNQTIILGVLDLSTNKIETPELISARIRRAMPHVSADRIVVAPDCGLKYLPRDVAFGKMQVMAAGARLVRLELGKRSTPSGGASGYAN